MDSAAPLRSQTLCASDEAVKPTGDVDNAKTASTTRSRQASGVTSDGHRAALTACPTDAEGRVSVVANMRSLPGSACLSSQLSRTRRRPAFNRSVITFTLRLLVSLFVSHWPNSSAAWRITARSSASQAGVALVDFAVASLLNKLVAAVAVPHRGSLVNAARQGRIYCSECRFWPVYEKPTFRRVGGRW